MRRAPFVSTPRRGRCALVAMLVLALPVTVFALLASGQDAAEEAVDPARAKAEAVLRELRLEPSDRSEPMQNRGALLRAGFDAFIERMDAFDGDLALGLAEELYREDPAIWSGFCLEGALRRSAPAGAGARSVNQRAALSMLRDLRSSYSGAPQAQIDVTHRIAILAAGFGDRSLEQAALGRALAAGGIDGAQISGLSTLPSDPGTAQRLFGALLDRSLVRQPVLEAALGPAGPAASGAISQDDEPVIPESPIDNVAQPKLPNAIQPEAAPWALRGHALASLELLRGSHSKQD